MSALPWRERAQPGYGLAFLLAFAVHAVLLAMLFFGVRFQSQRPDTVNVELWDPPRVVQAPRPEPKPEPPKPEPKPEPPKPEPKPEPEPPKPEPKPEPPKPEPKPEPEPPKPEPKPEPPKPEPTPDIAEKAPPKPKPKPEPKPEPKPKPKPQPKPEPKPKPKPKPPARDLELERRMNEELAREQQQIRDRMIREQAARERAELARAARDKAQKEWMARISAKIRGNIPAQVVQDVQGNPEAVFDVTLLPTGEVLGSPRMRKSSGNKAYDEAVHRAILRSSPLPKPDNPTDFQRELELRFRPLDK